MGRLRFGRDEHIECIVDIDLKGPSHEDMCLAYKTTTYWVGAGVYLHDDGYVVRPKADTKTYYDVAAAEGQLPKPLPPYSIPAMDYVWGYSLWICIALTIAWYVGIARFKKARQAKLEARMADAPLDRGPPRYDTEGDRFIRNQITSKLAAGESIMHQAHAFSYDYNGEKAGDDSFFLALTQRALYIIKSRPTAFGIKFDNEGVEIVPHENIVEAALGEGVVLFLTTTDGIQRGYVIKPTKKLSNQEAFLLNAARILTPPG